MNSYYEPKCETLQLLINTSNATGPVYNYPVNLSGRYKIKLVGFQMNIDPSPTFIAVQLKSSKLQIKHGNAQYPTYFYPIAAHVYRIPNTQEFEADFSTGWFDLQIVDQQTGLSPANFDFAALTFECYKL